MARIHRLLQVGEKRGAVAASSGSYPPPSASAAARALVDQRREEAGKHRLADSVSGVPWSSAETTVHLPVPFCPALSRM